MKRNGKPFTMCISQIFRQLIDLLLRVVLEPGDKIINTPPTFGMYSFDCSINGTLSSN